MSTHRNRISLALLLLSLALFATSARADVITDWNTVALDAVIAAREAQPRTSAKRYHGSRRHVRGHQCH